MQKFRCISLLLLLLQGIAVAQQFKAGIYGGISASQVHGDSYWGFHKAGLHAGAFSRICKNETHAFQFEICFIQKGSRKIPNPEKNDYLDFAIRLNYIEVPVLYHRSGKKFGLEAGLATGVLLKAEETVNYFPVNQPYRKGELSFIAGTEVKLVKNLFLNIRLENSLTAVRLIPGIYYSNAFFNLFNKGYYNNVLSMTFRYLFEKKDA